MRTNQHTNEQGQPHKAGQASDPPETYAVKIFGFLVEAAAKTTGHKVEILLRGPADQTYSWQYPRLRRLNNRLLQQVMTLLPGLFAHARQPWGNFSFVRDYDSVHTKDGEPLLDVARVRMERLEDIAQHDSATAAAVDAVLHKLAEAQREVASEMSMEVDSGHVSARMDAAALDIHDANLPALLAAINQRVQIETMAPAPEAEGFIRDGALEVTINLRGSKRTLYWQDDFNFRRKH